MSIEYTDYFGDEVKIDDVDTEQTIDEVDEVVEEETVEPITMMGVISNTKKVYMREAPSKESSHIAVLEEGDEVMIDGTDEDNTGQGWYHLITASGNEGYIMSDFVKIVE